MRRLCFLAFIAAGYLVQNGCSQGALAAAIGFSRAYCLSKAIRPAQAVSSCTAVLQKFNRDAKVLIRRGIAWRDLGENDFAIGDLSRAIRLNPRSAAAFFHRGMAREKKGQLRESLLDYVQALDLNPSDQKIEEAMSRVLRAFAVDFLVGNTPSANPQEATPTTAMWGDVPTVPPESGGCPDLNLTSHGDEGCADPQPIETIPRSGTRPNHASEALEEQLFLLFPALLLVAGIALLAVLVRRSSTPVSKTLPADPPDSTETM